MKLDFSNKSYLLPAVAAALAVASVAVWFALGPRQTLRSRVPGTDSAPGDASGSGANPVLGGKLVPSGNQDPPDLPGAWPMFRGPGRNGISPETNALARQWQPSEPHELWAVDVGEGYAGAAVRDGRVYLMDYDREKKQDALRCLSLADGRELWCFEYSVSVKRNHGMSRTVPAVTEQWVVAMGPKCHVVCVDARTGELRWGLDLVRQYGATVPPWYAGQCPLIDQNLVILAPGGKDALLLAVAAADGHVQWQTPNPDGWKMTHSSVMPMEVAGERMYVYCANNGVIAVSATNGAPLWQTTDWKISLATVPSPVVLDGDRLFLSGGYNAGSMMVKIKKQDGQFKVQTLFRLGADVFGATQHTPIFYGGHLYGVRADGKFVCLDLDGKVLWTSGPGQQFGLGSFIIADGLIFAMNDSGLLRLIEAGSGKYNLLAQTQVLKGRESWGPPALAGGRLLARDITRLICLDVVRHSP